MGNAGLFLVAAVLWLYPAAGSWVAARRLISQQRRVYFIYAQRLEQADILLVDNQPRPVLAYEQLTAAMADVHNLALWHGLEVLNFDAADQVRHDADINGRSIVEIRIAAIFTGLSCQGADFVSGLAGSAVFIRNLRMDFVDDGEAVLRIELSLFGME